MLACALVLVLAVLPPFVGHGLRHALMQGFDLTCHQIPERSFQVGGIPFALCHRCTGVVVGLVVGSLAVIAWKGRDALFSRHAHTILYLSILPMALDWSAEALGIWATVPLSRATTGLVFGVVAGYVFARALAVPPPVQSRSQKTSVEDPAFSHPTPSAYAR